MNAKKRFQGEGGYRFTDMENRECCKIEEVYCRSVVTSITSINRPSHYWSLLITLQTTVVVITIFKINTKS